MKDLIKREKSGKVLRQMNKYVILTMMLFLLVAAGCSDKSEAQQQYDKCTAVCAAVVDSSGEDALVTLEICRQECKKEFLDG